MAVGVVGDEAGDGVAGLIGGEGRPGVPQEVGDVGALPGRIGGNRGGADFLREISPTF